MAEYEITARVTYFATVTIEASSSDEAETKFAAGAWSDCARGELVDFEERSDPVCVDGD